MRSPRRCTRNGCPKPAVATLTYVYADSTAVVGPLAAFAEPHTYDLCEPHARSLTAPRGWELVRPDADYVAPPPTTDDLVALAEAVREAGRPSAPAPRPGSRREPGHQRDGGTRRGDDTWPDGDAASGAPLGRRGHLRVIPPGA